MHLLRSGHRTTCLAGLACATFALACGSSGASGGGNDSGADHSVSPAPDAASGSDTGAPDGASTDAGQTTGDGTAPSDAGDGGDAGTVPIVPAFYVATTGSDSNPGTLAAPFATFGKAQTAMQGSSTIKTTYVRAGSYTLPTVAGCAGGSSCGLELTSADDGETWSYYPPDGVDGAVLSGGSTASGNGLVVDIYVGANDVTINGLSISNFQYAGVDSGGGVSKLLVENCVIFDGYTASGSSNPAGVSCYGCADTTVSHNVFHDIAQFGVSFSNVNGDISNLLITGNVFYNTCNAIADCGALYVQDVTATATNIQLTDNYIHDGNTFATLGSGYGSGIYADDCTSNVTETGNVLTGKNGASTTMVHGGSNVHLTGNLTDLGTYQQHIAAFQTSGASGCSNGAMSGNEYENSIVIGAGGGGGYALLSGTPLNTPTIKNNDYFNYGGSAISSGSGAYADTAPVSVDPQLSGWTYTIASGSPVFNAPVSFPPLVGGWGPPGYTLPQTGSPPSSPH